MLDGRFLCQSPDVIVSEFCLDCLDQRTGFNAPATCALWCRWHVHLTYTHTHTCPWDHLSKHMDILSWNGTKSPRHASMHNIGATWQHGNCVCLFPRRNSCKHQNVCSSSGKENQPKVIKRSKQIARSAKVEVERMRSNKFKSSCMCFQHLPSFWWCTGLRRNIGTEKVALYGKVGRWGGGANMPSVEHFCSNLGWSGGSVVRWTFKSNCLNVIYIYRYRYRYIDI
jgi:hypothetical protein